LLISVAARTRDTIIITGYRSHSILRIVPTPGGPKFLFTAANKLKTMNDQTFDPNSPINYSLQLSIRFVGDIPPPYNKITRQIRNNGLIAKSMLTKYVGHYRSIVM
jgi:hypothetical protein